MKRTYDVVVVGGGAIGAACARELARAGRRVLVLDRGGAIGQAWQAAAGMLAPEIEAHADDAAFRLGIIGRDRYPALAAALRDATGVDIGLWREGIAHVARSEAEAAELHRKVAWLQRAGQQTEWIPENEARARWPWLGATTGVLWAPRDGAVEPVKLVDALLRDARRYGAVTVTDTVLGIDRHGGRVGSVTGQNGKYSGDEVVLAAGAWSAEIFGRLGGERRLPVEPVRGQMAALPWPAAVPPAIIYGHACYLLNRGGEAIAGSTMERAGFRAETTADGIASIMTAARALCPALADVPKRTWAGLRPVTPDGLPILGADPEVRGLWHATGHGRNGILLAGITGEIVAELLGTTRPADLHVDPTPFSPTRFLTSVPAGL